MAMLLALNELKIELKLNISVRHFEHGIRGEESFADAEFVRRLCESLSVPFFVGHGDVIGFARDNGLSIEEAARKLRYEYLLESDAPQIATAHTADDNAETVLFNLIRGTGIKGLTGIDDVVYMGGKRIVRPMINVTRQEIETYLREKGQDYCTDSTNLENEYSRNKIRNRILPLLSEINPKARENINRAASLLKENYIFVSELAEEYFSGNRIKIAKINKLNLYLRKEIIRKWLFYNLDGAKDVGRTHIEAIDNLLFAKVSNEIHIPKAVVKREYEDIIIIPLEKSEIENNYSLTKLSIDKSKIKEDSPTEYNYGQFRIIIQKKYYKGENIPKENYTKWFDYDKMENTLFLKTCEDGDYFTVNSKLQKKRFNRYCIDEKIPSKDRRSIPLLSCGNHIVWALGYRISEYYKISSDTKNMLTITVEEKKDGRND